MRDLDTTAKAIKARLILHCAVEVEKARRSLPPNRNRLSRHFMTRLITKVNKLGHHVKRSDVYYLVKKRAQTGQHMQRLTSNTLDDAINLVDDSINSSSNDDLDRSLTFSSNGILAKGGRKNGNTKAKKYFVNSVFVAAKNEVATMYDEEKKTAETLGVRLTKGRLNEIIQSVTKKRNLTVDQIISPEAIRQRSKRNQVITNGHNGPVSPLHDIEPMLVELMIQLCRMRQPLTVGNCKDLINAVIKDTPTQQRLVEWKKQHSHYSGIIEDDGQVGDGYWRAFLVRNKDKLETKKGEKFELNRALWTTYCNIANMYTLTQNEMVDEANVAVKLDEPVWTDSDGNICEEEDAVGCKTTINIIHPEYCIVADETGGNTCQRDDGHVGGERMICEIGTRPQETISNKAHHFTVMGLTLLTGEPLLCVIIFSGKNRRDEVELGYDDTVPLFGNMDDDDFMEKNMGEGKHFPGGPTCTFKGKAIPCMCRWTENGSITSQILKEICEHLDELQIFDRSKGVSPFFLLDGHGSRFELPFLEYINNSQHKWCVCIGVPYGTSMWQVGDSKEQNGAFKIHLSKFKRQLMQRRQAHNIGFATIDTTDIVPMINYAWAHSFANVKGNKKAICDRGWNPFNRNLLLDPTIRTTMNSQDTEKEDNDPSVIIPTKAEMVIQEYHHLLPNYDTKFLGTSSVTNDQTLNFSTGTSAAVLDTLVSHQDLHESRARIEKKRQNADEQKKIFDEMKLSAGNLWKYGHSNRLGGEVLERQQKAVAIKKEKTVDSFNRVKNSYIKLMYKADAASSVEPSKLKASDYKALIGPLRRKGDKPWTQIKNKDLPNLLDLLQKTRKPLSFTDHLYFNHPNLKIPDGINPSELDPSPSCHPEWNGAELKLKGRRATKEDSSVDEKKTNEFVGVIETAL